VSWIDSKNNLYLFGGYANDEFRSSDRIYCLSIVFTVVDYVNDLWKFDGSNWTWVAGSSSVSPKGTYGTKDVPDPDNVPGGRYGAVSWIDSENNLYLFGGFGYATSTTSGILISIY